MLLIALTVLCVIAALWIVGMWYANDYSVPRGRLQHARRVLVVFPHPDDETNVAGTLWGLRRSGAEVTLAVLTTGECGTFDAHKDLSLKATRSAEMRAVATLLDVVLLQADFGNGCITDKRQEVQTHMDKVVRELRPDLIITYDLAGLYGHPDHITCSEIATVLAHQHHTSLWYTTFPERLLRMTHLPTHRASDPDFMDKRADATIRIPIGVGIILKVRSIYTHASQRQAFQESAPFHLPLWLAHSFRVCEYFQEVR